ncbi:titin-like isoform X3 [Aricia agestis]|uniref:titin-like isoform X3 n=1 Tax=Aricia agestis TaxID=91739 RepID=UPI001C20AD95|nr:titin-like isoform X3 [Aricia agestis]
MALDVHLRRMGNSTWEFRLVGKRGFNISVTEAQAPERRRSKLAVQEEVVYSSPSSESSDEDSQPSQPSQRSQPSQEVNSGLYDPVLDDTEVIYETIGPADSDQQSNQLEQPTEVQFEIKQFTDQPDLTRSLTSSPYLIPTKPYRPFSAEPQEIPPVEDPIILNPLYHDVFPSALDTTDIEGLTEGLPPVNKFKLPISEQYDPNSDPYQEIKVVSNKIYVVEEDETLQKKQITKIEQKSEKKELLKKETQIQNIQKEEKQEIEYLEKIKSEIDLKKIEATALNIVEESIQQAVVVAEDIKKEIDLELNESETYSEQVTEDRTQTNVIHQNEISSERKSELNVHEEESSLQTQRVQTKESETISKDRKDIIVQNETSKMEENEDIIFSENKYKNEEHTLIENKVNKDSAKTTLKSNFVESSESENICVADVNINDSEKVAASKLSAEQRAYTIGLQTIPNIKGTVQSSNHFNLLLKTFFVHLTDVMVALSRFMLTEPVKLVTNREYSVDQKDEVKSTIKKGVVKDNKIVSKETKKVSEAHDITAKIASQKHRESIISSSKEEKIKSDMTSDKNINKQKEQHLSSHVEETVAEGISKHELKIEEEEIRKRKLSGAKIAQIEGMKPEELTNKMDKVISEFQKKSGTSETVTHEEYSENHLRSRNSVDEKIGTTQIETEKKAMEVFEAKSEKSLVESKVITQSIKENQQIMVKEKEPLTYVAIVEAHVYTNKDAIFEEQMRRMSEAAYESTVSRSSEVKSLNLMKDAREESLQELQSVEAKRIESCTSSSLQKNSANLESSVTKVALQKTTEVVEPTVNIETEKKVNLVQAQATMQSATKTIAAKTSVAVEEDHKIIQQEQRVSEKTHVLVEKPIKVVAEQTEAFIEDNIKEVKTAQVVQHTPKPKIETPVKTVAEIKEIYINEEDAKLIEKDSINLVKPKCAIDTTVKAVAQKTEVLVGDNVAHLETTQPVSSRQAQVGVNESVATVITEMAVLEPKDEMLEVPEITMKQPQTLIQEPILRIPEVVETCLAESKGDIEIPKVVPTKATVEVQVAKVAAQATIITLEKTEKEFDQKPILTPKSAKVIIEEPVVAQAEIQTVKVEEAKCEITDVTDTSKHYEEVNVDYKVELPKEESEKVYQEESAELKIIKEQIIEVTPPVEVYEDFEFDMKKIGLKKEVSQSINVHEKSAKLETSKTATIQAANIYSESESLVSKSEQTLQSSQSTVVASQVELNQTDYQAHAKSVEKKLQQVVHKSIAIDDQRHLTLRTDLTKKQVVEANGEDIQTPSPISVPPTPLVDEYVFKLEATLPKNVTPVPRDCSVTPPSEHEDPNIVKKKLVPQIVDTNIEQVIYDPPLPTPTSPEKKSPPRYVKPGLRGGSDRPEITKEEIMDIERKSSLLTSAIDETIRSIEEYKESVGIDIKQETTSELSSEMITEESSKKRTKIIVSNGYSDESDREINGSDNDSQVVIETQNDLETNESEQSVEQTVVFNGKINNGAEQEETTNDEINKIANSEENHEDLIETVTINLSKMKRDSLQETNIATTEASNDVEETIKLNGNSRLNGSSAESVYSDAVNEQQESTNFSATVEYTQKTLQEPEKKDPLEGYRPVEFNPEVFKQRRQLVEMQLTEQMNFEGRKVEMYKTDSGEIIGSQQGIIDGLEEPVVDPEIAKELGKPGMPGEKVAELISGEADILREAHVMGLARVLKSHMHRTLDDDSSDDLLKIKPSIETLKDSEVLKALNEEILRSRDVKMKEERRWTTFLQKPAPKPKQKVVFCGNKEDALNYNFENFRLDEDDIYGEEQYRVRIVKQPKPRIAPDFKPEDFDTGPLPWEQRAVVEEKEAPEAPPVEAEDPILIPEDGPEFVEAVDPLPESEVPDLEDTGIPLPPPLPPQQELPTLVVEETQPQEQQEHIEESDIEEPEFQEASNNSEEMEKNKISEQLLSNIESMVDPNATLEEQLAQMRAQLAALAQLPNVIQQTLELVTKQICQISQQKVTQQIQQITESQEQFVDAVSNIEESHTEQTVEKTNEVEQQIQEAPQEMNISVEEQEHLRREEEERIIEEQKKLEQQKKELIEQMRIEQESRQVKQRSTPRVGKPRPMFGPPVPVERPVVLPGGRRWRKPEDAYNEQKINEALTAQAEVIKGKAIGVNFLKYEKPPVSLDHLQQSEVFKVVHNMDQKPLKQVELLTPVIAEADYRERKVKSRFSPVSSVANRWPSRGCSPAPQGEIFNAMP